MDKKNNFFTTDYFKLGIILLIGSGVGYFICDILNHVMIGTITSVVTMIALMFPFGFIKVRKIK